HLAAFEDDPDTRFVAFEAAHALLAQSDAEPLELCAVFVGEPAGTVGAQHDVPAPQQQLDSNSAARAVAAAVGRERLIAHFPAFAVRAVVDGFAVQLFGSGNIRQVVDETGRD